MHRVAGGLRHPRPPEYGSRPARALFASPRSGVRTILWMGGATSLPQTQRHTIDRFTHDASVPACGFPCIQQSAFAPQLRGTDGDPQHVRRFAGGAKGLCNTLAGSHLSITSPDSVRFPAHNGPMDICTKYIKNLQNMPFPRNSAFSRPLNLFLVITIS